MLSFVLRRDHPPVSELAYEIGVKPVLRRLQTERCGFTRQIPHPELHLRQAIKELRTLEFLFNLSTWRELGQLAGLRPEVVLLESLRDTFPEACFVLVNLADPMPRSLLRGSSRFEQTFSDLRDD